MTAPHSHEGCTNLRSQQNICVTSLWLYSHRSEYLSAQTVQFWKVWSRWTSHWSGPAFKIVQSLSMVTVTRLCNLQFVRVLYPHTLQNLCSGRVPLRKVFFIVADNLMENMHRYGDACWQTARIGSARAAQVRVCPHFYLPTMSARSIPLRVYQRKLCIFV